MNCESHAQLMKRVIKVRTIANFPHIIRIENNDSQFPLFTGKSMKKIHVFTPTLLMNPDWRLSFVLTTLFFAVPQEIQIIIQNCELNCKIISFTNHFSLFVGQFSLIFLFGFSVDFWTAIDEVLIKVTFINDCLNLPSYFDFFSRDTKNIFSLFNLRTTRGKTVNLQRLWNSNKNVKFLKHFIIFQFYYLFVVLSRYNLS